MTFFFHGLRDICVKDSGQDFPEAVLRMAVVEAVFPAFHGRQAAQDQDFRIRIIDRFEGMNDGFRHENSFFIVSSYRIIGHKTDGVKL